LVTPVISKRPLLSAIVKDTSEESFFWRSEIVAAATGCLEIVSVKTPFTDTFWATADRLISEIKNRINFRCIADGFSYENIPGTCRYGLTSLCLMLMKVNSFFPGNYSSISSHYKHNS